MKQKRLRPALFLLVCMFALHACHTTKEATTIDNGSSPSETNRMVGTIEESGECGFYIHVAQGEATRSYFPVNLEDKFKVAGMRVKFASKPVEVPPPQACPDLIVITVSDLTPIR